MGNKSFATNANDYVTVQLDADGNERLHIQGIGVSINRPYGFAVTVSCPPSLASWVHNQPHTLNSGVSNSTHRYVGAQATVRGNNAHFQVAGNGSSLNREYGAAFDVSFDNANAVRQFICSTHTAEVKAQEAAAAAEAEVKKQAAALAVALAAQKAKTYQVTMS